ncbi:acyl-CoA synthetase (plasmid) [Bartonella sp. HY329]|uniref:acyl-CoA synthetase n=1 Tax=unclassified Bartonella TaxID=2645622 RepID=UPI0021CA1721|nr:MULTISPECIES: acyl-CoA synthetase [unclassified Bartonella]UXM96546.1 acyl-CoA synthetase [Bartonella sp. HY329]UXN10869.1 acyl-CoA synthetase [Bartonella sp. HY328]
MSTFAPKGGVIPCSKRVMNLSHFLAQAARRFASDIGFVHGEQILCWQEINARVDAMAVALSKLGISKGDRIVVQSQNCLQMFETMFVCFRLGAVWVPTNFRQTADEVAYLVEASGAKAMICNSDFPDHVIAAKAATPSLDIIIEIGEGHFAPSYDRLVAQYLGEKFLPCDVEHDDPCWFFFTSGTTGRPKAAVLTHGQMGFVVTNHLCDLMPATTNHDASLVVAPLSHGAGIHQLVNTARAVKTILPCSERFDANEIWQLVQKWQVSNIFTVPTITKMMAEAPSLDHYDHSSLRYVIYAGAPMYREDQKFALRKLGKVLVQYFGLGEVTGNITVLPPALHDVEDGDHVKIGTCGIERTAMQVQVQDDNGKELAPFETGEICVCGLAVFAGYYNNDDANAKAFRHGWFRTGDLGHMDEQGFLYITGRASDMYISGGSNVYPREIEEKLLTHPDIDEVAILGIPDAKWGEVGIAICVAHKGCIIDESAIISFLEPKIARYKLPKKVLFWESLPKSAYGKITKKMVREVLEQRGEI